MRWAGEHAIATGDVLSTLRELPDNEFDAVLSDFPYGLSFMGKAWDYDVPSVDVCRELLRVLKPGAPLLAFGGSRTFHRIAVNIEDAGFELRDCLMWLYAKGFPKSLDVSKALDKAEGHWRGRAGKVLSENAAMSAANYERTPKGEPVTAAAAEWAGYGTALKPAFEPIILARKPLDGTVVENVTEWGVGGLAIDACRIGDEARFNPPAGNKAGGSAYQLSVSGMPQDAEGRECVGRWPANLILDEEAGAMLDASVAPTTSVPYRENTADGAVLEMRKRSAGGYSDSGGPSRFFYSSKVSTKEREFGCESLPLRSAGEMTGGREEDSAGLSSPRTGAGRGGGARNVHPTLKPLSLARWLASLIKPPTAQATLLIPYSGAGSEMIGALQAGWPMVFGIERDPEYVAIANARLAAWREGEP